MSTVPTPYDPEHSFNRGHMGQIRDNRDPELEELGARLRALRGRRSIRAVASEVFSSRSTLSRVERGEVFPDAGLIERLDVLYGLGGELVAERQRLLGSAAVQRAQAPWRRRWVHHYPADYAGEVYVQIVLPAGDRPARIRLRIRWGEWQLDRPLHIYEPEGVTCVFTKGDDGLSKPVIVTLDRKAAAAFGISVPPGPVIDINAGWVEIKDSPSRLRLDP